MASKISVLLLTILLKILTAPGNATNFPDPTRHRKWYLVNPPNCGTTRLTDKIIGGRNAHLGEFPWMVALNYSKADNGDFVLCGGSIINKNYVLTAAHCFSNLKPNHILIGEWDKRTNPDCERDTCAPNMIAHEIEYYLLHEFFMATFRYNGTVTHDVALIRLKQPIVFNEFVRPICLPYDSVMNKNYIGDKEVQTIGWGHTVSTIPHLYRRFSPILKVVDLPIIPCSVTKDIYICAGTIGSIPCFADSGGPLMKIESVNNEPAKYFIIGIAHKRQGYDCHIEPYAAFMYVPAFMTWILDNIY